MANIKTIDDVPGIILYTPLEKPDEQEKVCIYYIILIYILIFNLN